MKKNTVRNLMIGVTAVLGASYAIGKYVKNKKRKQEIEKSKLELEEAPTENNERVYYTIGTTSLKENNEETNQSIKEIKKVI